MKGKLETADDLNMKFHPFLVDQEEFVCINLEKKINTPMPIDSLLEVESGVIPGRPVPLL